MFTLWVAICCSWLTSINNFEQLYICFYSDAVLWSLLLKYTTLLLYSVHGWWALLIDNSLRYHTTLSIHTNIKSNFTKSTLRVAQFLFSTTLSHSFGQVVHRAWWEPKRYSYFWPKRGHFIRFHNTTLFLVRKQRQIKDIFGIIFKKLKIASAIRVTLESV